MEKIIRFNKCRAFNKSIGPAINPNLISIGLTFIPDYRVPFFWTLLSKGHSTNFPFLNSLKILGCATNQDMLLLATLWNIFRLSVRL